MMIQYFSGRNPLAVSRWSFIYDTVKKLQFFQSAESSLLERLMDWEMSSYDA